MDANGWLLYHIGMIIQSQMDGSRLALIPPKKSPGSGGERVPAQAQAKAESQVPQETAVPWLEKAGFPWVSVGILWGIWGRNLGQPRINP